MAQLKYISYIKYYTKKYLSRYFSVEPRKHLPVIKNIDAYKGNVFQVVGIPRSGTTLLNILINNHPDVLCIDEPFLKYSNSGFFTYSMENNDYFFPRKPEVFFRKHISNRGNLGFKETYRPDSSTSLKENYSKGIPTIAIIRDPVAVWYSVQTRFREYTDDIDVSEEHFSNWFDFVEWILTENVFYIRYEDLVLHPEESMKKCLGSLDVAYSDEVFKFKEQSGGGDEKAYEKKAIDSGSLKKYLSSISPDKIREIIDLLEALKKKYPFSGSLLNEYLEEVSAG